MEDRRRQRVVFENLAREMLRYLENSEELKVCITELQEQLEVFVQIGTTWQQVAQQVRNEIGQKVLKSFGKKKKSYEKPVGQGAMRSGKAWWSWKEGVRTEVRKYKRWTKDKKYLNNAIEGKLGVQSRANDRLHDQIIEEIQEIEHTMTEKTLNLVRKENDLWRYQNEKEEAQILQGASKFRKDEEMAWAPPGFWSYKQVIVLIRPRYSKHMQYLRAFAQI